jgi:hypothetical protein
MCRSLAQGGRRCGGTAVRASVPSTPPSTPSGVNKPSKADAYAQASRELQAARDGLDPSPLSVVPGLVDGPLARQAQHVREGGDGRVHAELVGEGRQLAIGMLTGRGVSQGDAEAAVDRYIAAYKTWQATPAPRGAR